ncbi:MAG: hypothetical protein Q7S51_07220 [Gallionellaceae bacterium]|nr:hypothetical protein [Gallionellaceae bacterium]
MRIWLLIPVCLICSPMVAIAGLYSTLEGAVRLNNSSFAVHVSSAMRQHDFGPSGGFVDAQTLVPRLATILTASGVGQTSLLSGNAIPRYGIPGRVEWTPSAVIMANYAGEGQPGKPYRAQATSYPLAPDVPLVWSLIFQLGDKNQHQWQLLPPGQDPALLWEVKAPGLQPSLAMIADTDDLNPSRLMLFFSELAGNTTQVKKVATVHGLSPATPIDVRIEAVLDERGLADGGKGNWQVWVNGERVLDREGPTLSARANEPHQWSFGIYRYKTLCPSNIPRYSRWEKLRLERRDDQAGMT